MMWNESSEQSARYHALAGTTWGRNSFIGQSGVGAGLIPFRTGVL